MFDTVSFKIHVVDIISSNRFTSRWYRTAWPGLGSMENRKRRYRISGVIRRKELYFITPIWYWLKKALHPFAVTF